MSMMRVELSRVELPKTHKKILQTINKYLCNLKLLNKNCDYLHIYQKDFEPLQKAALNSLPAELKKFEFQLTYMGIKLLCQ